MPTYTIRELGWPRVGGFLATMLAGAIQVVMIPLVGALSDRLGRLPIATVATIAILITAYPLFARLAAAPTIESLLCVEAILGVFVAAYAGAIPALMSELFPTRVRTTAVSTSYSVTVAIFGGFAPFIIAWLIDVTRRKLAPNLYPMFSPAIELLAVRAGLLVGVRCTSA